MEANRITIHFFGPLKVILPDGSDATPKSAKARGLLALVAETNPMTRSRRWLEDKLWSTRAPQQASGSLRQTLTELRKSLEPFGADVLATSRLDVSLNSELVATDLLEPLDPKHPRREFLEGLDVKDQEFETWLSTARVRYDDGRLSTPVFHKSGGLKLHCTSSNDGSPNSILGEALSHRIGESVAEQVRAWSHFSVHSGGLKVDLDDIEVNCHVVEDGRRSAALLRIIHMQTGKVLYARECDMHETAVALISSDLIKEATFDAAESVMSNLPLVLDSGIPEVRATTFTQLGMKCLFSFNPIQLNQADFHFARAFEENSNGVYLAWRALTRTVQDIERFTTDRATLLEEAEAFTTRALEMSPDNPLVQAIVAYVRLNLFDNLDSAVDLAQSAIEINPANAFAIQSLSVAYMMEGKTEKALELSQRSRVITQRSKYKHWWAMFHCLVCIANGRFDEAITAGEIAARMAPSFRPTHRHLFALYSHKGDTKKAREAVEKLQSLEEGFSVQKMIQDVDYPASTLRASGLLNSLREDES